MAMNFKKGDIILPENQIGREDRLKGLYHAAVVWQDEFDGADNFVGVILTKKGPKDGYNDNILMEPAHFSLKYSFIFNNSHFINQKFLKFAAWGPFKKVGQLTDLGIEFIAAQITHKDAVEFKKWL